MNYQLLFARGSKYADAAIRNWDKRKDKLIHAWGMEQPDYRVRTPKKERLYRIIGELEERIKQAVVTYHQIKERQKQIDIEAENTYVNLFCPKFSCRYSPDAIGVAVRLKNYTPGNIECDKCGTPLITKEDEETKIMLFEMGIR